MAEDLRDRYCGTLLGLAVGDAMGGPLEFMSRQQVQIKHGLVTGMIGGGWLGLRPGAWTDDTTMALALADSLVEKRGFDRTDVARRYVEWFRSGPPDIGNTVRSSLELIAEGMAPDAASRQAHEANSMQSATNGALMRCAPLALYGHRDAATLIRISMEEARITHHDVRAGSASAALNLLLKAILDGEEDRRAVVAYATDTLMENTEGADNVMPEIAGKQQKDLRPTGYVVDTLETALWMFCHTRSLRECIVQTVNLGGDADTTGAVAGALAGAFYGMEAIPRDWLATLQDKNRIQQTALRLHRLFGGSAS
jgi:ADP-ribosyl-[dinitrogen reductase] hydrolase